MQYLRQCERSLQHCLLWVGLRSYLHRNNLSTLGWLSNLSCEGARWEQTENRSDPDRSGQCENKTGQNVALTKKLLQLLVRDERQQRRGHRGDPHQLLLQPPVLQLREPQEGGHPDNHQRPHCDHCDCSQGHQCDLVWLELFLLIVNDLKVTGVLDKMWWWWNDVFSITIKDKKHKSFLLIESVLFLTNV